MTGYTHLVAGIVIGHTLDFTVSEAIVCMVASLLPDIDSSNSILGRFNPLARFLKHRGLTHHPFTILVISVLLSKYHIEIPFFYGAMSHLLLDSLTPMGIPFIRKHRLRLAKIPVGSTGEWVIFSLISLFPIIWR